MNFLEEKIQYAVQYFKGEKAYDRLFELFRKKYESLGRIGGNIATTDLHEKTLLYLAEFFGVTIEQLKQKGNISLQKFEAQIQQTRFEGLDLKSLLDAYFGEEIISKKESALQEEQAFQQWIHQLIEQYSHIAFWLEKIAEKAIDARWMVRFAKQYSEQFERYVAVLAKAYVALPEAPERIPLFSQKITGDPHAFDIQTDLGRMFLHLLNVTRNREDTMPTDTEEINELLAAFYIYRDDLLNFVTCANLIGFEGENPHPVWEAAAERHTVQLVPLREMTKLTYVQPRDGKKVWAVENSGVCAALLDYDPSIPIIATNGQATLATLLLFDLIVAGGYDIYYAGDFDPEGLRMADRYKLRYPEHVHLWQMDIDAYVHANPQKILTAERLEKLKKLETPVLVEVGIQMVEKKTAGYQEALIDKMIQDLSKR